MSDGKNIWLRFSPKKKRTKELLCTPVKEQSFVTFKKQKTPTKYLSNDITATC